MSYRPMRPIGSALERGLKAFIDTLPDGVFIAEIGCFCGESTRMFLAKAGKIFCVDPWCDYVEDNGPGNVWEVRGVADIEQKFDAELAVELKSAKVVKCKTFSVDAANRFTMQFDVVYIDGNHSLASVIEDIKTWIPRVKPGGILAGHDYDRVPVQQAVMAMIGPPDQTFEDGTWAKRL